jgi:hypothetical protein
MVGYLQAMGPCATPLSRIIEILDNDSHPKDLQHMTHRSLEEAWIREEVKKGTKSSLVEARIYEEVQWVMQRSLEEACVHKDQVNTFLHCCLCFLKDLEDVSKLT